VLVVVATLTGKSDKREELTAVLGEAAAGTRSEPGCSMYAMTRDLEDPDRYVSVEVWEDQAALDAHFVGPNIAKLFAAAGELFDGGADIKVYETNGPKA
jgi:quinol monooxygenase YgiN